MRISKINKSSFIDSGIRLDASFHLSDAQVILLKLKKSTLKKVGLKNLTKDIFKGNIFKRTYVNNIENGYEFISASDMMKLEVKSEKMLSKKYTNVENLKVDKNWILVSRSGTLGNTTFTNDDFKNFVLSDDLIRVIPDDEKVLSGYLYAYLASKFGYNLLTQSGYGGVIQHIEPHHLYDLPVPIIAETKQNEIHNLIIESSVLRVEANKLLQEAIGYFNKKYPIKGLTRIFSKNLSELNFSWAAYNNNVECDKIYSNKENEEFVNLSSMVKDCFSPPMFKHIYLDKDNGHPFLTGAELNKFNKKFYRWLSTRGVKNINDYKVKKGTLLLYKSGNTDGGILGNVFIADDILDGACLSDHVIRIFTDDLNTSYWLFAFLKSDAGKRLLQKTATGSMIPFITTDRLLNLSVPKPNEDFLSIAELIKKYIELNVQSQLKENQAIDLIEKEIDAWQ